jgi:chemotaxis response regulator CheB
MDKIRIMVICRHAEILATIERLINNNPEWTAIGFGNEGQALVDFFERPCSVVLLGNGLTEKEEQDLTRALKHIRPAVPVVKHYGGGSGLLSCEIYEALKR